MAKGGANQIPAIPASLYGQMTTNASGVLVGSGQGGVIARILHAGAPAVGATVTSPAAVSDLFFDTSDDTIWSANTVTGTGVFGDVWIPVAPDGPVTLAATPHQGTVATTGTATVFEGELTFITIDLP
jgi:hypothetical protein